MPSAVEAGFGESRYACIDAPATPELKAKLHEVQAMVKNALRS